MASNLSFLFQLFRSIHHHTGEPPKQSRHRGGQITWEVDLGLLTVGGFARVSSMWQSFEDVTIHIITPKRRPRLGGSDEFLDQPDP